MATRRERVVLELQDDFTSGMARAAAATALLDKNLDSLSGSAVRSRRSVSDMNQPDALPALGKNSAAADRSINQLTGRLRLMADAVAILGPGLVPLGAGAVPALAGMAAQLTMTAAAGGTALLAFKGLGEGLKALNEAQLDPSAANLEKLHQAMEKLGPAGVEFVQFLDSIGPQLKDLQSTAREGMFPGVEDGITSLLHLLPQVDRIVGNVAEAMGQLAREAGAGLSGEGFSAFFDYLETDARPILLQMGRTLGNFAEGLSNMLVGFGPLSSDFSGGLLEMSRSFSEWSRGLEENDSFQAFIDYVQESGPKVLDLLGSLVDAFVNIAKAAAPVGDVVLPALTKMVDAVAAIAGSDLGSLFFTAAAGLAAYSRAAGIAQGATSRLALQGTTGLAKLNDAATKLQNGMRVGGAAVGMMALSMTDLDDKAGVANTAMLGLAGFMVGGPWGAAAGTVVGGFLDIKEAASQGEEMIDEFNDAIRNTTTLGQYSTAVDQLRSRYNSLSEDVKVNSLGDIFDTAPYVDVFTGGEQRVDAFNVLSDAEKDYAALTYAAEQLAGAQGMAKGTTAELDLALQASAPAMSALHLSTQDLIDAARNGDMGSIVEDIARWQTHADSAAGRTDAFATTVEQLGFDALSTADAASQMGAALEALLSPTLSAEEATDAWHESLQKLREELESGAGFKGFSDAAMENRQISRDYVTDSMERLKTLAGLSTTTEKDMAQAVKATREEFIKSGIAAGFSREAMVKRANALKLTPKLIRTVFEAAGITQADLRARQLKKVYQGLPKDVRTAIKADGIPQTKGEVDDLVEKYHLTEKQRTALITLKDLASQPIGRILEKLGILDRNVSTPNVVLNGADAVQNALGNISGWLSNLNGQTATTWVTTRHVNVGGPGPQPATGSADGGTVPKTGRGYADRHPYLLADGEEVISNRFGQADRHRELLKAINSNRLADGGTVMSRAYAPSPSVSVGSPSVSVGGARVQVFIDGREVRHTVRSEIAADRRYHNNLEDRP